MLFSERLGQALLRAGSLRPSLAVLTLDLNGFEPVNDPQGPRAADPVLRVVAARLRAALRRDDLSGRLQGDAFACLVPSTMQRDRLSQLACKLLNAIGEPVQLGEARFALRPSIGVAIFPGDGSSAAELMAHADAAMDRARRLRSGYSFFDSLVDA